MKKDRHNQFNNIAFLLQTCLLSTFSSKTNNSLLQLCTESEILKYNIFHVCHYLYIIIYTYILGFKVSVVNELWMWKALQCQIRYTALFVLLTWLVIRMSLRNPWTIAYNLTTNNVLSQPIYQPIYHPFISYQPIPSFYQLSRNPWITVLLKGYK